MQLSQEEIIKIAHLARLALDERDVANFTEKLTNIMNMMENMSHLDLEGIEPMFQPLQVGQRLRPDEVTEHDQRPAFQAIAPLVAENIYLVPQVIE